MVQLALIGFALPMLAALIRRHRVFVPRGFGWWLVFLVWVAGGVTVLQVDALGAVADTSSGRYVTWLYRLLIYLSATIALLYVLNLRTELTVVRVTRILSALFITTVAGGLLGVLAPTFEFRSLAELLLPSGIANQPFINKLIHPAASQIMVVLGFSSPRPSAPYDYTNTWGLMFALTIPFFFAAWCGKTGGWRRWWAPFILVAALVPAIYSVNRGLWAALVAMALFIAVRAMLVGRPSGMLGVLAGVGALAVVLTLTPLGSIVQARFANEGSAQGRGNLGTLTVRSVSATSPLIGLGSTRNVQGNWRSIAGGQTAQCPHCSPPALGTQGQLWLVVYSQGWLGLLAYLTFFGRALLSGLRTRRPEATAATCTLLAGAVTFPVYSTISAGMFVEMIAVALVVRATASAGVGWPGGLSDVSSYGTRLGRQAPLVGACMLIGSLAGGLWQWSHGQPAVARQSVLLTNPIRIPVGNDGPMTIDTEGQLVTSSSVTTAAARATRWSTSDVRSSLHVTAPANTRLLVLSMTGNDSGEALAGVRAATDAFLEQRHKRLRSQREAQATALESAAASLDSQLRVVNLTLDRLKRPGVLNFGDTRLLRQRRLELLTQITQVNFRINRVIGAPLQSGSTLRPAVVTTGWDRWRVSLTSGLLLGLLASSSLAMWFERRGARLRRTSDVAHTSDLPVIAEVVSARPRGLRQALLRRTRTAGIGPSTLLSEEQGRVALGLHGVERLEATTDDPRVVALIDRLLERSPTSQVLRAADHAATATIAGKGADPSPYARQRTAIVVASDSRESELAALRRDLERAAATVVGVVLWRDGPQITGGGNDTSLQPVASGKLRLPTRQNTQRQPSGRG